MEPVRIIIRRNHKMFMPCGFCVDHLLFAIFVTLRNENRPFGLADHIRLLFESKKNSLRTGCVDFNREILGFMRFKRCTYDLCVSDTLIAVVRSVGWLVDTFYFISFLLVFCHYCNVDPYWTLSVFLMACTKPNATKPCQFLTNKNYTLFKNPFECE